MRKPVDFAGIVVLDYPAMRWNVVVFRLDIQILNVPKCVVYKLEGEEEEDPSLIINVLLRLLL